MRERIDGIETRKRILEAACEVFAEKGYRGATIAQICKRAKTNVASVNYHFRDKESLYVEVWRFAGRRATELYPVDGGVSPNATAEERLRGHIHALLKRMTDTGRLGQFHKLFMMEMTNPTGFITDVIKEIRQPHREHLRNVLRELLGQRSNGEHLDLCELSVMGQCRAARFGRGLNFSRCLPPLSEQDVQRLADHITQFSLAGIRVMRGQKVTLAS